jgi:hypothetical protein
MRESNDPRFSAGTDRRARRDEAWFISRPDRVALWAFVLTLMLCVFAAVSSAHGASGGVGQAAAAPSESAGDGTCEPAELGDRVLRIGDCGTDVKTLNWILKASPNKTGLVPTSHFNSPTDAAVRTVQRTDGLNPDGVVDDHTRTALKQTMPKSIATWYGPGFYGSQTACGETLHRSTVGVANRTLPCGTRVTISYGGKFVRARVIDRGPYANGADWDLTGATAEKLGFASTDKVRVAAIK